MKTKLFYFLVASLFVLSSCSSDTDGRDIESITKTEPKTENQVLLKKNGSNARRWFYCYIEL